MSTVHQLEFLQFLVVLLVLTLGFVGAALWSLVLLLRRKPADAGEVEDTYQKIVTFPPIPPMRVQWPGQI